MSKRVKFKKRKKKKMQMMVLWIMMQKDVNGGNVVRVVLSTSWWIQRTLVNGNGMRICEMWQKQTLLLRPLQRRESSQKWQIPNYPTTLIKHVILSLMLFVLFVHSSPLYLFFFFFTLHILNLLSFLVNSYATILFVCHRYLSVQATISYYSCYHNQYF